MIVGGREITHVFERREVPVYGQRIDNVIEEFGLPKSKDDMAMDPRMQERLLRLIGHLSRNHAKLCIDAARSLYASGFTIGLVGQGDDTFFYWVYRPPINRGYLYYTTADGVPMHWPS